MNVDSCRRASRWVIAACLCANTISSLAFAEEPKGDPAFQACPGAEEFYRKKMEADGQRDAGMKPPVLPELRKQLLEWEKADQEVRKGITAEVVADPVKWKRVGQRMQVVDELSYRRIKEVIDEYGFPTRAMVGADGASAAFVLVQHQVAHPQFQQFVLDIMGPLAKRGEVDQEGYALLTDRVLVQGQHKPQRYGSQFKFTKGGRLELEPVEDREHLDARRAALGMPPIEIYLYISEQAYRVQKPSK